MDPNLKQQLVDTIAKSDSILIALAKELGFEGLASATALYLSLIKLDKNAMISASQPSVADAQKLYAVDRIGQKEGSKNPVVIIDNAIESVDKVTHFLEGDKLKLVIHPLPGAPIITKDQINIEYISAPAQLIFSIGFTSLHDLRNSFTHEQEITPETIIINITEQESNQKFAQMEIVSKDVSGIAEAMARTLRDASLPLDEDISYNLYEGIRERTDNYAASLVKEGTLEIASWLLKFGAGKASLAKTELRAAPIAPQPTAMHKEPGFDQGYENLINALNQTPPLPRRNQPSYPMPKFDLLDKLKSQQEVEMQNEQAEGLDKGEAEGTDEGSAADNDWLKPPKIYKGSKVVGDGEGKG